MRKSFFKLVSLSLVLALIFACSAVTASAITWDKIPEGTTYASGYWSYSYTYGSAYKNMTRIPLTGDGARDTIAVAMSQLNYLEADNFNDQGGQVGGTGNYTEYGVFTNVNGAAWCASFCSWALYTAKCTGNRAYVDEYDNAYYMGRNGYLWAETYVPYWSEVLNNNGRYEYSEYYGGSYVPQTGDLIFFTYYNTPLDEDHIGLVVYTDDEYVYTIEGNTSSQTGVVSEGGGVFFKRYALDSDGIAGYGRLPYETVADLPEIDYSGANPTPGLYVNPHAPVRVYVNREKTMARLIGASNVFEVLSVEEDEDGNTLLYSKYEYLGSTYYGWVVNDSNFESDMRTIQIYATPKVVPKLSSTEYTLTSENKITGVALETTASDFLSKLTTNEESATVELYDGDTLVDANSFVGTGMTVKVTFEGEVVSSHDVLIIGDVNGDGTVSSFDYVLVKRHVMRTISLESDFLTAADADPDGTILFFDYVAIKRHVLGTFTIK